MEFIEFIFEILLDLIIDGSLEAITSRKVPKIMRCLLTAFIVLFFAVVIFGLLFIGISLWDKNIFASLFIIAVSILLLVAAIFKFHKIYVAKRKERE